MVKGGDDRTGGYDAVADWWKAAPNHDSIWGWGETGGVAVDNPDRIIVATWGDQKADGQLRDPVTNLIVVAVQSPGDREHAQLALGGVAEEHRGRENRTQNERVGEGERLGSQLGREVDQVLLRHPLPVERRWLGGEGLRRRSVLAGRRQRTWTLPTFSRVICSREEYLWNALEPPW